MKIDTQIWILSYLHAIILFIIFSVLNHYFPWPVEQWVIFGSAIILGVLYRVERKLELNGGE